MPTYDRWSNTRKLRTIAKHIEVTVGKKSVDWSDSDFEQEMEGLYVNTNASPYRTEPVYINVHEAKDESKNSSSDHRIKSGSLKSSSAPRMSPNRPHNPGHPSRPPPIPSSPRPTYSPNRPPQSSSSTRAPGQPGSHHATATRAYQSSSHHSRHGQSPTRPT